MRLWVTEGQCCQVLRKILSGARRTVDKQCAVGAVVGRRKDKADYNAALRDQGSQYDRVAPVHHGESNRRLHGTQAS